MDNLNDSNGQTLYALLKQLEVPEFVKNASSDELFGKSESPLPPHLFGDPVNKTYPCHTKAATWLSAAKFSHSQMESGVPDRSANKGGAQRSTWVQERIKSAARSFAIDRPVSELLARSEQVVKDACTLLPDSDFALIVRHNDGTTERHYPMRNGNEVKAAADYLFKHRDAIPFAERKQMARNILEKAGAYGVGLHERDEFLEKQAGFGACSSEDAARLIWSRVCALGRTDKPSAFQHELGKMAYLCLSDSERFQSPGTIEKLAEIIDAVDRKHGFYREYGNLFQRPEDVLFVITRKFASRILADHCETASGKIYKIADMWKIDLENIKDLMGEEFARAVSAGGLTVAPEKLAEAASALPRSDAELLDRLFDEAGVPSAYKEAAYHQMGLEMNTWRDLAKLRT